MLSVACAGDAQPEPKPPPPEGLCSECGGCDEALPVESYLHVVGPIEYADSPPSGGDHDACWAPWGIHEEPVPERNWVHNLEHGGIVFLYDCPDGCDADLETVRELAEDNPRTLVTPYPGLRTQFAVVAWGHRLLSDCADARAFKAFYDAHFDRGRESVDADPPPSCQR